MFFVETMYTFFGSPHIHVFSWKNEINFTRINKHGQSIQLGYSFLGNEKTEIHVVVSNIQKSCGWQPCLYHY
jgi:hypothetical protein